MLISIHTDSCHTVGSHTDANHTDTAAFPTKQTLNEKRLFDQKPDRYTPIR